MATQGRTAPRRKPAWKEVEEPEARSLRSRVARRRKGPRLRRYAVVYDIDGPRVRLGMLWFVVVLSAMVAGAVGVGGALAVGLVYGGASAVAAGQVAAVWRKRGRRPHQHAAMFFGGLLPLGAVLGAGGLGLALLALAGASWMLASGDTKRRVPVADAAGATIWCALPPGMAAACMVLLVRLEIGAAVSLLLLVSAYECGDYLIGSGSRNPYEGPTAGIAGILVVTFVISALGVPPFDFAGAWAFGALAAVLCPLGQLAASALLPAAKSSASALRRLDSLLLNAPAWTWLIGLYITANPTT